MDSTILVCDNEEVLRGLVRASLDGNGYTLVEARDGDEAVEQARLVQPDLILLDMMMPSKSGLEVLAELRSDPELRDIPVVMLTARAQVTDREAARLAGADRFLAKPFSPLELVSVVKELLGNDHG
jgi:two-component system alkaline phosphatase synthesis response regulator PhoP/two-component system response regulator VicR